MTSPDAPYHAHIYFSAEQRPTAAALRDRFRCLTGAGEEPHILFVGPMRDGPVGPHPIPQYEIHFAAASRSGVIATIEASGLRALVHPLTDDDLADHTTLGDDVIVSAQSGLHGEVPSKSRMAGSPAYDARMWLKVSAGLKQLPDLLRRVRELEEKLLGEDGSAPAPKK